MHNAFHIVSLAALIALIGCAQPKEVKTGHICAHPQWEKGYGPQGMDIYQDILVQGHNRGVVSIYNFTGDTLKLLSEFPLESAHKHNHSNVLSFGPDKFLLEDPLPLLYVSQCSRKQIEEYKDVCYVERILPGFTGSQKIQTIAYADPNHDFGYALQWVVDAPNRFLYGYGNTTEDRDVEGNRHRIIKFALPATDQPYVVLQPEDALENYLIEDYGFSFATIGQGLFIYKDRLYMPTGFGSKEFPSQLFVWNLETKQMDAHFNMTGVTTGEQEDAALWKDHLVITGLDGIFVLPENYLFK